MDQTRDLAIRRRERILAAMNTPTAGFLPPHVKIGTGPPVLLVPIVDAVSFVWVPLIDALAEDHTVLLFSPEQEPTLEGPVGSRISAAVALLDHYELRNVRLVAWSDGAAVALGLLALRPDLFCSFIGLSIGDRWIIPRAVRPLLRIFSTQPMVQRFTPSLAVSSFVALALSGPRAQFRWLFKEVREIPGVTAFAARNLVPLLIHPLDWTHLGAVDRVILVRGRRDHLVTKRATKRLGVRVSANKVFANIPDGEHFPQYFSPRLIADLIRSD